MEETITVRIYRRDFTKIQKFMDRKGIKNNADGIRVAVEYADAHGALK